MKIETNDPLATVLIVNYNNSNCIDQCLKSVINQNYKKIEIIVVDDDSPDGTINIVDEKRKHNKRVRSLLRTDERGLTSALNHGIANANGKNHGTSG